MIASYLIDVLRTYYMYIYYIVMRTCNMEWILSNIREIEKRSDIFETNNTVLKLFLKKILSQWKIKSYHELSIYKNVWLCVCIWVRLTVIVGKNRSCNLKKDTIFVICLININIWHLFYVVDERHLFSKLWMMFFL